MPTPVEKGTDTQNLSSTATVPSATYEANRLIFVTIAARNDPSQPDVSTVVGLSSTWVEVDQDNTPDSNQHVSVWRTMLASQQTGTIAVTMTATCESVTVVGYEIDDVDTSGTFGSGAIVQSDVNTATTGTTFTVTLASFADATNNMAWGTFMNRHVDTPTFTVEGGYTGGTQVTGTQAGGQHSQKSEWKTGEDTLVTMTTDDGSDWAGVAIEIAAAAVAAGGLVARHPALRQPLIRF